MSNNKIDYRCDICGSRNVGYKTQTYDEWDLTQQKWKSFENYDFSQMICRHCNDPHATLVEVPVGDKILIGLGFQKRTGKDAAADILVEKHGFVKTSFAAPLKELAQIVCCIKRDQVVTDYENSAAILKYWMYSYGQLSEEVFDKIINLNFGVDEEWLYQVDNDGKQRHLLQFLGTDLIRNSNANYWVDAMFHQGLSERTVISDMRFLNEMDAVSERGGVCVKIIRDSVVAEDSHISENELSEAPWDFIIHNDSTMDSLETKLNELVIYLTGEEPCRKLTKISSQRK